MIAALRTARSDEEREAAQTSIDEDPLSVEVRGDWHVPGGEGAKPSEFMILLCTGGPAVRIRGELDRYASRRNRALNINTGLRLGGNCWT